MKQEVSEGPDDSEIGCRRRLSRRARSSPPVRPLFCSSCWDLVPAASSTASFIICCPFANRNLQAGVRSSFERLAHLRPDSSSGRPYWLNELLDVLHEHLDEDARHADAPGGAPLADLQRLVRRDPERRQLDPRAPKPRAEDLETGPSPSGRIIPSFSVRSK